MLRSSHVNLCRSRLHLWPLRRGTLPARRSCKLRVAQPQRGDSPLAVAHKKADGPSTDLRVILERLTNLALPYWKESPDARWKLAGVVGLTLATTAVSVVFNFLGRDFFTALSEKDEVAFKFQLAKYMGGFALGIPVFVFKSYFQSKLALEWRQWMTERLLSDYLAGRTFYGLQQTAEVDNPDQRISSDVATFTDTALGLSLTLLNAAIDLVSFSGILFSIYPPLFAALLVYSLGGTAASVALGKNLVTLNFNQEAREADFRYGLVRVRENAESIAFYGGDEDEKALLKQRLQAAVANYLGLLTASRNLDFFTSYYRYLIQLLPAAVVAPLYFQGKIDFGVINQSQSAFNHILNDVSLVIYQIEALAGFSAVVDRLGEFREAMDVRSDQQARLAQQAETGAAAEGAAADAAAVAAVLPGPQAPGAAAAAAAAGIAAAVASTSSGSDGSGSEGGSVQAGRDQAAEDGVRALPGIQLRFQAAGGGGVGGQEAGPTGRPLLRIRDLTVVTPRGSNLLLQGLDLEVPRGSSLLVMGPSGAGKTSLLRAVAGLWSDGCGSIDLGAARGEVLFLPQRPYMVLGSLRDQALYPRRCGAAGAASPPPPSSETGVSAGAATGAPPSSPPSASTSPGISTSVLPSDAEVAAVLELVQLGHLLTRYGHAGASAISSSNGTRDGNGAVSSSAPPPASPSSPLDVVADWSSTLSLGEQQRLGWARLLLSRPRLALLDEATSALDQETEARLYKVLEESGITYISVGHRSTLREFHRTLLRLRPGTTGGLGWEVRQLREAAVRA